MPVAESKEQVQAGGDGPQRLKPLFRCGITARLKSYPDAKPSLDAKREFSGGLRQGRRQCLSLAECGFVLNAGGRNGAQGYRPVLSTGQAGMPSNACR